MTDPAPTTPTGKWLADQLHDDATAFRALTSGRFSMGGITTKVMDAIPKIEAEAARSTPAEVPCDHPPSKLTTSTYNGPDGRMAGVEQRCECGASWREVRGSTPAEALDVERLAGAVGNVLDGRRIGRVRLYRNTITSDDWEAIAAEYARLRSPESDR